VQRAQDLLMGSIQGVFLCERTRGVYYDYVSSVGDEAGESDVGAAVNVGRVASINSRVTIHVEVAATRQDSTGAGASYDCLQALIEIQDPVRSICYREFDRPTPIT
jgi:hypothetical protein